MATYVSQSDFVNVTMEEWQKNVPLTVNVKHWLNNNLKTKVLNHQGESLVNIPFQIQLIEGAQPSGENVANPTPRSPNFAKGQLYMKKIVARMLFSEETISLNKGSAVIVNDLNNLMNGTLNTFNMTREFMMHQPGSGVLCQATGAPSGHTVTVESCRWLRVGMTLDGYHSTNKDCDSVYITDIDYDANTFTLVDPSGDVGSINSDTEFMIADTYVTSHTAVTTMFCNGIELLINDTDHDWDVLGIDRGTYNYAKAVVKYGGTPGADEALTLARMRAVMDSIDINWGQDLPSIIYCSVPVFNAYQEVLRNAQQPTVNMPAKDGYPAGLEFVYNGNTCRIVSSRLCLPETMFFINPDHLIKYKAADTGWDTLAGPLQKVAGYQQYEKVYRGWENYGVDVFKAHGRLADVTGVA